jgi:hypothetical protein
MLTESMLIVGWTKIAQGYDRGHPVAPKVQDVTIKAIRVITPAGALGDGRPSDRVMIEFLERDQETPKSSRGGSRFVTFEVLAEDARELAMALVRAASDIDGDPGVIPVSSEVTSVCTSTLD